MFGGGWPPGGDTEPLTKEQTKRRNIIAVFAALMCVAGFIGIAASNPYFSAIEHTGTVVDVRIISKASAQSNASDEALGGAIVGGLVTGTWGGAAVGAVVGAEGAEHRVVTRLEVCTFKVDLAGEGPVVEFFFTYGDSLKRCSLMRQGDVVRVRQFSSGKYQPGFSNNANFDHGTVVP